MKKKPICPAIQSLSSYLTHSSSFQSEAVFLKNDAQMKHWPHIKKIFSLSVPNEHWYGFLGNYLIYQTHSYKIVPCIARKNNSQGSRYLD